MLKKLKNKLKLADNRGSSFVLVIVSATFLSILVSALLMGTLLAYKLRFYKLNSLNNFYSVEKAMDEIYAGIGAATNEHLYSAYTTTAEIVVYYKDGQYNNLTEDEANDLFKQFFMQGIKSDKTFSNMPTLIETLKGYITDPDVSLACDNLRIVFKDKEGREKYIKYVAGKNGKVTGVASANTIDENNIEEITFRNIGVKRTITLSSTDSASGAMAPGTYVQTITTDLVLKKPEYNVSFDMAGANSDSLYNYALLADMGLQVSGTAADTEVNIKGNIYTASDYYNKDYNGKTDTKVTNEYSRTVETKWGSTDESAYSGIFVQGDRANLTLNSDIIVNSGSLAAFDGAEINLSGRTSLLSELWTDNIIIGGDEGGQIKAAANAYVYDDTELNAEKSELTFTRGTYFGYSYTADDVRSINLLRTSGNLATGFKLKSHFSDSAIIVNGKNSTLDLSSLESLYIAGKSYIEFSKIAANTITDEKERKNFGLTKDSDYAFTALNDYSTGQSLDVKSNQLIFLTQWDLYDNTEVVDENGYTHVTLKFPKTFSNDVQINKLYTDFVKQLTSNNYIVEAIKETVSGHDYYYLYIQDGDKDKDGVNDAEEFVEKYYDLLNTGIDETKKKLYNVANYENFEVKLLLPSKDGDVDGSKIKTSGAVTAQNSDNSLFVKASADTSLQVDTALKNATGSKTFSVLLGNKGITENNNTFADIKKNSETLGDQTTLSKEEKVSNQINYMYINMKDHLSVVDKKDDTDTDVSAWEVAGYTKNGSTYTYAPIKGSDGKNLDTFDYNYSLTPLTKYVDYDKIFSKNLSINKVEPETNAVVIINANDVTLKSTAADGALQGIVICGGNVTFDKSVKSFRGMIISGAKIICNSSVDISADASFTATVLEECSKSDVEDLSLITREILKNYVKVDDKNNSEVSGSSLSDISYSDILAFQNWKKNVE